MTRKLLGLILIMILVVSCCGIISAEPVPAPPTLKLTVELSPLKIYPPMMIYTTQLSYIPAVSTILSCDFYNSYVNGPVGTIDFLGSAPFDKTGKAVLNKQMKSGACVAFAKTVINGIAILSNKVEYKVP